MRRAPEEAVPMRMSSYEQEQDKSNMKLSSSSSVDVEKTSSCLRRNSLRVSKRSHVINKTTRNTSADPNFRMNRSPARRAPKPSQSRSLSSVRLGLCTGFAASPHPQKAAKGGEDAYFISANANAFGVFDGVGGWAKHGIDPALYSRKLAELTRQHVDVNGVGAIVTALKYAVSKNAEQGSSTACVASLNKMDLVGANVGDSGLIVIREGRVVFETKTQQHTFNTPFQLGPRSKDSVDDGEKFQFRVHMCDVIVTGTDGLWDNVHRDIVAEFVLGFLGSGNGMDPFEPMLTQAARSLTAFAKRLAMSSTWVSPFAEDARKAGFPDFAGGKMDDITVLVGVVVPQLQ